MNPIIVSRIKSLAWRFGIAFVTFALAWVSGNLPSFGFPVFVTGMLTLVLNEVTKAWADYQASFGKTFFGRTK